MLIDLKNENLSGKELEILLDSINITTNKNSIPNDKKSPQITSGLRIGTPSVTTRGMSEREMKKIASIIASVIKNPKVDLAPLQKEVLELTKHFPIYKNLYE